MEITPGPWSNDDLGVTRDADGQPIQTASRSHGGPCWGNAVLIAAAPMLYDALNNLVKQELFDSGGELLADMRKAVDVANNALAYAEHGQVEA